MGSSLCFGSVSPIWEGALLRGTCANQVKFVDCAGKITVIFSNAAGQQHYEVHGCGISIINVLVLL